MTQHEFLLRVFSQGLTGEIITYYYVIIWKVQSLGNNNFCPLSQKANRGALRRGAPEGLC